MLQRLCAIASSISEDTEEILHASADGRAGDRRRSNAHGGSGETFEPRCPARNGRLVAACGSGAVKVNVEEVLGCVLDGAALAGYGGRGGSGCNWVLAGVLRGFFDGGELEGVG